MKNKKCQKKNGHDAMRLQKHSGNWLEKVKVKSVCLLASCCDDDGGNCFTYDNDSPGLLDPGGPSGWSCNLTIADTPLANYCTQPCDGSVGMVGLFVSMTADDGAGGHSCYDSLYACLWLAFDNTEMVCTGPGPRGGNCTDWGIAQVGSFATWNAWMEVGDQAVGTDGAGIGTYSCDPC